ncbi:MAG TPA: acetylxylan esterase [Pirellulales bacterium]|nr:acetylxylan esterase [Pirellulales bacterium]
MPTFARADEFPEVDKLPARAEMPDPLVMLDGTRVTTVEQWNERRKPELKALFQHYMYGEMPPAPQITSGVWRTDRDCLGGKATMKQVKIAFGPPDCPTIDLVLFVPNHRERNRAPPVVLGLNFAGNHTVLDDQRIALPQGWLPNGPGVENNRATDAGRGKGATSWEVEHLIDRGFALATFYYGDVAPDHSGFADGVFPFFRKPGQTEHGPTDWGAIAAWAWGLERAVDYLVTDHDVDRKRIVIFGHSRNGKAAILAGAFDERIAVVIPHQAGCGGSGPSRSKNPKAESVTRINQSFPHWFDAPFKEFGGQEEKLPFDQNCLVALCAPRPVLFTCGEQDQWANPSGQLEVLKAADPVYRLFGVEGIPADAAAEDGKRIGNRLGYYIRDAKHMTDRAYWDVFLDFADAAFRVKK